jgi:hypothetical protein
MRMGTVLCKNRRREAEISNDISWIKYDLWNCEVSMTKKLRGKWY